MAVEARFNCLHSQVCWLTILALLSLMLQAGHANASSASVPPATVVQGSARETATDSMSRDAEGSGSSVDRIEARLRGIEAALEKSWWEEHSGILAILGTIAGLVGALGAVALANALNERSRKKASKAILDTLVGEAIDDLDRLCYITELHAIGSRSKASISQAGRRHLMGQLAASMKDEKALVCLTRVYNAFDRIVVYQDRAVESDASADPQMASYSAGVAAAFGRSSVSVVLQSLDELCRLADDRVRISDQIRMRAQFIEKLRDDPSAISVIGTIHVKKGQGDASRPSIVRHLKWMQDNGVLNPEEDLTDLLRRLAEHQYIILSDDHLDLSDEIKKATRANWPA